MILQELSLLYDRLVEDPQASVPARGTSMQPFGFRIVLTREGKLVAIDDIRQTRNGKSSSVSLQVLGGSKPSGSGLNPSFLWDNCGYLLGYKGNEDKNPERTRMAFEALRQKHLAFEQAVNHPAYSAVCRFLQWWNPDDTASLLSDEKLCLCNGVFRIQGDLHDIHQFPQIRDWWVNGGEEMWKNGDDDSGQQEGEQGMCLISGKTAPLALLHEPIIKGVRNAQMSGAKLVSFNCASFTSYGKEQSLNAPVSEDRAFAYCCALNYLLGQNETRLYMADATYVLWADAPPREMNALVSNCLMAIVPPPDLSSMDVNITTQTREILDKLAHGKLSQRDLPDSDKRFFILGLSPNASRLSIRLWYESTYGDMMESVQSHYNDLKLHRQWTQDNSKHPDPELPAPYAILRQTVRDPKEIPAPLAGAFLKSILTNTPYPDSLAQAIMRRIKVDKEISYLRCAMLKAWLLRRQRQRNQPQTITVMLDIHNTEPGYLQGRLFAVYAKTQEDAFPGRKLNTTIRDSFYSSASTTPFLVMSRLARLYSHHLGKLDYPKKVFFEKKVQEIQSKVDPDKMPRHLNLEQQAFFNLGYYHQMNDFYKTNPEQQQTETLETDDHE